MDTTATFDILPLTSYCETLLRFNFKCSVSPATAIGDLRFDVLRSQAQYNAMFWDAPHLTRCVLLIPNILLLIVAGTFVGTYYWHL